MFAKFHHARGFVIVSLRWSTNLSAVLPTFWVVDGRGKVLQVRSAEEFNDVQRLIAAGMNECADRKTSSAALDLGIPRTRSSKYFAFIHRKAATARLDAFVGPKDARYR